MKPIGERDGFCFVRGQNQQVFPQTNEQELSPDKSGVERRRNVRLPLRYRYSNEHALEHDPEKWKPVFRKDHAQSKC
jgi:hypothetical protein